jgi:hypothetical protein
LRDRLERDGTPRFDMLVITLLTGATGFLVSVVLLIFGVETMWLRYAIAFGVAYLEFLWLLRLWLRNRETAEFDVFDAAELATDVPRLFDGGPDGGGGSFGGAGASTSFDDGPSRPVAGSGSKGDAVSVFDADEGIVVIALIAAALGLLAASFWMIWSAPALLAELALDASFVAGLYHRLRRVDSSAWIGTAVRRTALPFAITGLLLVAAGWVAQDRYPSARTIGDVVEQLRGDE